MSSLSLWSVPSGHAVEWRLWGDAVVAFCHATGATHLLTDAACAVFGQLAESGARVSAEELLERLGSPLGDSEDDRLSAEQEVELLRQTLDSLESFHLIRRHD